MRPVFLDLDSAFEGQEDLIAEGLGAGGERVAARDLGPALRLWSRPPALQALAERLRDHVPGGRGPDLVFAGSGDFHHVTPLLLQRAIGASYAGPVTVVHFDNHPDWVRFENGLHCGSWVGRAARLPGVARVITVGVCSHDIDRPTPESAHLDLVANGRLELYAYRNPLGGESVRLCGRDWPTVETLGEGPFADLLASRIETDAVYITIDKDVLRADDAVTNWDQGQLSLDGLERLVRVVAGKARLIGADVVGDWSPPRYGPDLLSNLLKRGEAFLDQPRGRVPGDMARTNEATNLRLLSLFAEVMP